MEFVIKKQKSILHFPYSLLQLLFFSNKLENLTVIDVIILLGYLGVVYRLIKIARKISSQPQKKPQYISIKRKKEIINKKKILRLCGPVMIILIIGAYIGLWFLFGFLPTIFIHLFILMTAYFIFEYVDVTLEDRITRSPPGIEKSLERDAALRYRGIFKKLWYVNAILLLLFCVVYTQVKDFPSHGTWGIIAWSIAIFTTYSPVAAFSIDVFKEIMIPKERRFYICSIFISWIIALYFLRIEGF